MQVSENVIIEITVLVTATVLITLGKLDPLVFMETLVIIFGERVYTAVRKQVIPSR